MIEKRLQLLSGDVIASGRKHKEIGIVFLDGFDGLLEGGWLGLPGLGMILRAISHVVQGVARLTHPVNVIALVVLHLHEMREEISLGFWKLKPRRGVVKPRVALGHPDHGVFLSVFAPPESFVRPFPAVITISLTISFISGSGHWFRAF